MRKIAFYLYNRDISRVNFTLPLDGNPGVGGSEYLIVLTAWQLAIRENELDVILFVDCKGTFPKGLKTYVVKGIDDAMEKANNDHFDIFVVDHKRLNWSENPFSKIKGAMKIVCWCHNFVSPAVAKIMSKSLCVQRVIAVGREQMDLYRDDRLFLKSDYIYNSVPVKGEYIRKASLIPYNERPHAVAYLGSLVKDKCFHMLASVWRRILKQVPDAELYVIGSGKIYSKNTFFGKYGITTDDYENMFMPFLTDEVGNIIPSVHFLGAMANEKYEILKKIRVGCPNPTGASETFCLSAVEMQAMGCSVVAMEAPGYYDTFYNGIISKNLDDYVRDIVNLLLGDAPRTHKETLDYIYENFSIEVTMNDWERLLWGNQQGYLHPILPLSNPEYRYKLWKELSRRIRNLIPIFYLVPNLDRITVYIKKCFLYSRNYSY